MTFRFGILLAFAAPAILLGSCSGGGPVVTGGAGDEITPAQKRFVGSAIVRDRGCVTCHEVAGGGGSVGPNLDQVANRRSPEWLRLWLRDPNALKDGTKMPNFQFSDPELDELVGYLRELKRDLNTPAIMSRSNTSEEKGRMLFDAYDCSACHRVGAAGRFIGPNLTWVGKRRPKPWENRWLEDPSAMKARTFMPNFKLPQGERLALVEYLHGLQGQRNGEAKRWEDNTAFFLDSRPREVGAMVYRRFGCDGCHGERGEGGYANVNAAPDEKMPVIAAAARDNSRDVIKGILFFGRKPTLLDPAGPEPLPCPAWKGHMTDREADLIYEYLLSVSPPKKKFRFKKSGG
ncbi:MAG: c-type cytochrome [Candidatus Krumholzibacteria bacterium]